MGVARVMGAARRAAAQGGRRFPDGPAAASALRRALGALWLADALVKILIPFGDRAAGQWYEQIMTAETGPLGMHRFLAWQSGVFIAHPFLWWLPARSNWSSAGGCSPGRAAGGRWAPRPAGHWWCGWWARGWAG
jgi:hypothetical protein